MSLPGFQPAGQTSPWVSVYWKAWTNRSVSSTERPTGRSFMVIWRSVPLGSMINRPLKKKQQRPYKVRSKAWQKDVHYHFNFYRKCFGIKYIINSLFLWTCQLFGHTICRSFNHHKHNNTHHAFLTELEHDSKMQSVGRGAHTKLTWFLTWDCDLDPGGTLHKL